MKAVTLTKSECVRRARNLNQQAIAYKACGRTAWYKQLVLKREQYMSAARLFA